MYTLPDLAGPQTTSAVRASPIMPPVKYCKQADPSNVAGQPRRKNPLQNLKA